MVKDEVVESLESGVSSLESGISSLESGVSSVGSSVESGLSSLESGVSSISDDISVASDELDSIFDSKEAKAIFGNGARDGWGPLDDGFIMSRVKSLQRMRVLAGATTTGCWVLLPLLEIEIVRDVYQALGLFFGRLYKDMYIQAEHYGNMIWGRVGSIATLDFSGLDISALHEHKDVLTMATLGVCLLGGLIAMFSFFWFVRVATTSNPDRLREGHETMNWREQKIKESKKVKRVTMIITISMSVYLPVARVCTETLWCSEEYGEQLDGAIAAYDLPWLENFKCEHVWMKSISGLFVLFFVLPFPILCWWLIQKNKPHGSPEDPDYTHDEDGHRVKFTTDLYNERVENDPDQIACPYRSLYQGFERRWAPYKVCLLGFKFFVVVPLIVLQDHPFQQTAATLGIVLAFFLFAMYATPFVDRAADKMDLSGRWAMLVTVGVALYVHWRATGETPVIDNSTLDKILTMAVQVTNGVAALVMMREIVLVLDWVRLKLKNYYGRFDFSDTCANLKDQELWHVIKHWNVEREAKHRIWHAFWDSVLLNQCGDEVATRLLQLKDQTRKFGLDKIELHWKGFKDPIHSANRIACRKDFEGVDIYWDHPETLYGPLKSKTKFAKMWIDPYPFHMVIVYDDCDQVSFIWGLQETIDFLALQNRQDIATKRENRTKIRAMAANGTAIQFPFSRMESETVQDGTRIVHYTDSEGRSQAREEPNYITVHFECFYTYGVVTVKGNSDKEMAPGFKAGMGYADGTGEAWLPNTRVMHKFTGRAANMGPDHMGLDGSFDTTARLKELYDAAHDQLSDGLPKWNKLCTEYREKLFKSFEGRKESLHNRFWAAVYNNHRITEFELARYFTEEEKNPVLKKWGDAIKKKDFGMSNNTTGITYLLKRRDYAFSNPCCMFWYVVWDDFWACNKDMKVVKPHREFFDPTSEKSLCYRPMPKAALIEFLGRKKLLRGRFWGFWTGQLFSPDMIDEIYTKMKRLSAEAAAAQKVADEERIFTKHVRIGDSEERMFTPSEHGAPTNDDQNALAKVQKAGHTVISAQKFSAASVVPAP